jgi:para-aminobenzoate synthetase component 1
MNEKNIIIEQMNSYGKDEIPFLFIIDFEMKSPLIFKLDNIDQKELLFNINGFKNYNHNSELHKDIIFNKRPISFDDYRIAFVKVMENINAGNTYLLNLTFPTHIATNLTLKEIFLHSTARYKLLYQDKFVVFSPEIFLQIDNNKISSNPMKGTIDAGIPNAKDKILADEKELAEHNTIVDLIRNDLNMVADNVHVEKFRYSEKIKTNIKDLLQVSSKIIGNLDDLYKSRIGDIIFELLPAGSVSGAPKKKTLEIINEVENYNRGFYTGIFGYFDGKYLDSGVMIRFIEQTDEGLIFKSGGGITSMSNAEQEYQELIDKVYVPIIRNDKNKE